MKTLEQRLTECNKYTRYQVKKIVYVVKTLSSDISKLLLMGIFFHKQLPAYIVALTFLFLLRSYSGGLHFNTYLGCFLTSLTYFILSILVLPTIQIDFVQKIILLTTCMIICDRIGPITSKHRPPLSQPKILICRNITVCIIFLCIIIQYVIPGNPYINIGFWVVILHTLQLFAAKLINYVKKQSLQIKSQG